MISSICTGVSLPQRSNPIEGASCAIRSGTTIAAVADLNEGQMRTRQRVESLIDLMAPALDLVLAVGDRMSRVVEPEDHGYYPARPLVEPESDAAAGER
jgi:hypothetical protein